jgi:hypothetical protein
MEDGIHQTSRLRLRASGFPFQIAIADLIRTVPNGIVLEEEFPWQNEEGNGRFLDILATKTNYPRH